MNRRVFLCGSTTTLLGVAIAPTVNSQTVAIGVRDDEAAGMLLEDPGLLTTVQTDVFFVQSSRIQLKPMGYEGSSEFSGKMGANRARIFAAARSNEKRDLLRKNSSLVVTLKDRFLRTR